MKYIRGTLALLGMAAVLIPAVSTEVGRVSRGMPTPVVNPSVTPSELMYVDHILAKETQSDPLKPLFAPVPPVMLPRSTAEAVRRQLWGKDTITVRPAASPKVPHLKVTIAEKSFSMPRRVQRGHSDSGAAQTVWMKSAMASQPAYPIRVSNRRRMIIAQRTGTREYPTEPNTQRTAPRTVGTLVRSWFHNIKEKLHGRHRE